MILVHVQHFLDPEGRQHFSQWIEEVREALRTFRGFRSIRRVERVEAPDETHLLLSFETEALLRQWAQSDAHDQLISRLAPYQRRTQESTLFRVPEPEH